MKEFWMLFVQGGGAPTVQHTTPESAKTEAERLARATMRRVYVLRAIACVQKTDITWTRPDNDPPQLEDDIPF